MQNMGKTMGITHIQGFGCLSRIHNILASWINREESVRERKSDSDQMAKMRSSFLTDLILLLKGKTKI